LDRLVRTITDAQRRARLGLRQALVQRVDGVLEAVEATTCLHATEPPTVYLSVAARSGATRDDVDRALYADRTVVKQLAMRRTLFVFPRELLPGVWGGPSARVAGQLTARLAKEVEANGIAEHGSAWVAEQVDAILAALVDRPSTSAELREVVPGLSARLTMGTDGSTWGGEIPIGPRVVGAVAASGRIVRGTNAGDWRTTRPRWTRTEEWLGEPPVHADPAEGYRTLVGRWLDRFGPGAEDDLVWWLGSTKAVVRAALADLGAVQVALEDGRTGFLLPDDLDDVPEPEPWAALLPVLDPATMGWKHREFYLDPEHRSLVFDRNGNGGTTAWWCGRIVGCWVQDPDGAVVVVPLGDPGSEALSALDREAERLTAWLAGDKVSTVYASPLMRQARPG
jgi:hypothetical protein